MTVDKLKRYLPLGGSVACLSLALWLVLSPALAAVPGFFDWKVLGVDATGTAVGTSGNPLFTAAAAAPGTLNVQGVGADNAALAGNPLRIGVSDATNLQTWRQVSGAVGTTGTGVAAVGETRKTVVLGAAPTAQTAGNFSGLLSLRDGLGVQINGHPNLQTFAANYTTAQTNTAVLAGAGGQKYVLTAFMVTVANATTVDVSCRLGFGATVPAYGNTQILGSHPGIAAGSGFAKGDGSGIIGIGADSDPVSFTCSVPTSGSLDLNLSYFTEPS